MFVGQLPKHWNESEAREIFTEFGDIYLLNILRDRETNISRGCCFVTFYHKNDALKAKTTLHNVRVLPGMHHPIQMKPADTDQKNEDRKLFVGMISKKMNDDAVRELFIEYGDIEECRVLRTQDGQSRGCAFVTFDKKEDAQAAVRNMHQAKTLDGVTSKIVVKFADTQRDKERKRIQQLTANGTGNISSISSNLNQLGLASSLQNLRSSSLNNLLKFDNNKNDINALNNNLTSSLLTEILGQVQLNQQRNQLVSQQTTTNTGTISPTSILSLMNNQLNSTSGMNNELFPASGLASPFSNSAANGIGGLGQNNNNNNNGNNNNNISQALNNLSFLTGGNSGTQTPVTPQNGTNSSDNNVTQLLGILQTLQSHNSNSNSHNHNQSNSSNHGGNSKSHQQNRSLTDDQDDKSIGVSSNHNNNVTENLTKQIQQFQINQQQNDFLSTTIGDLNSSLHNSNTATNNNINNNDDDKSNQAIMSKTLSEDNNNLPVGDADNFDLMKALNALSDNNRSGQEASGATSPNPGLCFLGLDLFSFKFLKKILSHLFQYSKPSFYPK